MILIILFAQVPSRIIQKEIEKSIKVKAKVEVGPCTSARSPLWTGKLGFLYEFFEVDKELYE